MYENENYSGYNTYPTGDGFQTGNGSSPNPQDAGSGKQGKEKRKKSGYGQKFLTSVSLGLFFGLFAGIGFYGVTQATGMLVKQEDAVEASAEAGTEETGTDVASADNQSGIKLSGSTITITSDVSDVVEEVMPAMVSIVNNYTETGQIWGQTYSEEAASSGSGIIVAESDTELLIVSNNHVVENTDMLTVTFIDGTEAEAHIKGLDADMDLAVIAVALDDISEETKSNITVATLGDSDSLELGMPVIAIGNALGYGQSVTTGVISALDREVTFDDGSTGKFIQTDAAINPGNSGGALLNINGEVIGINSSKIGGTVVEGMGYAIPITSASPIIAELMERQTRTEKVATEDMGYIGISLQEVNSQISQMYNMPEGIYVVSVEGGSAAEEAGIMSGDIITKFDGSKITSYSELQNVLQYYAAGTTAKITVMRPENGQYVQYDLDITLGSRPSDN